MNKVSLLIGLCIILCGISGASAEVQLSDITNFLEMDTTNEHESLPGYTCGHFTRELAHNASEYNISMGAAILSNHPVFGGRLKWSNHILNYIEINNILYFIEPRTDRIMSLEEVFMKYKYIRLYPNGTQVPSYWNCNLAPSIRSPNNEI